MDNIVEEFVVKLKEEGMAESTIDSYTRNVQEFLSWFSESYGNTEFKSLYRANVNEFKNYLRNIKRVGKNNHKLDAKSVNAKMSALIKFNELMQPNDIVITKKDLIRIQENVANPTNITKDDVEAFRQQVLQSKSKHNIRNYTIVTIMAYGGLRISEVLNLKKVDVSTAAGQIKVTDGKGDKQRIVIANSKIIDSLREYRRIYNREDTEYLFYNADGKPLCRDTINKVFKEFSTEEKPIWPHLLRHWFCTRALESGAYSINEVAQQAGHSNIHTTLIYTNPNLDSIRRKAEML